jgi:hypothetical protein
MPFTPMNRLGHDAMIWPVDKAAKLRYVIEYKTKVSRAFY